MMKLFLRSMLFCIALCAFFSRVNAQEDFIITLKNDTILGSIKPGLLSQYILESNGGENISFSPETVNGYYLFKKKQKFISNNIPKSEKRYFLRVLEAGKINLYEHKVRTPEGVWIITWFASKEGGGWVDIITDRIFAKIKLRKDIFAELIGDNKGLNESFQEEKKYNFDIVRKYVVNYNNQ
ncbi:hypothetical protein [Pedobacter suwonensis]|uniref:hypothetical protein n=1 Tax=Pedobacter suwonensis TaxID=332999 RepID=UPI003685AD5E